MVYVPVYSGQWLNGTLYSVYMYIVYVHVLVYSGQWLNGTLYMYMYLYIVVNG